MKTRSLLLPFGAALASLVSSTSAHAAGTALDVQSSRGTGMASAMTSHTDDAASIFFNPAGIAQGKKVDIQAGMTFIIPGYKYYAPDGSYTRLNTNVSTPFHVYATAGITDDLSVGIGVNNPAGLTLNWPSDWVGRSEAIKISHINYTINPTVAYKWGPLKIGAGFQAVRSTVELTRALRFPGQEGQSQITGGTWGFGGNVGVQFEAIKQYLNLGVAYRSRVALDYDDGRAHFSNVPPALQNTFFDQGGSSALVLPHILQFGASTRPTEKLLLAFDAWVYFWSTLESIDINFEKSTALNTSLPKNWSNRVNYHLGGEYQFTKNWAGRLGVMYDPSPSPPSTLAPSTPDANRLNLAAGVGYKHDCGFFADLGYRYLVLFKKDSSYAPLPGQYGGNVNLFGLTVGFRFDYGDKKATTPPPDAGPAPMDSQTPAGTSPGPVEPAPNPAPDSANPSQP